jgi:hypothetical protein
MVSAGLCAIPSFDASMLVDLTYVMGLFANVGLLDSGLPTFLCFLDHCHLPF